MFAMVMCEVGDVSEGYVDEDSLGFDDDDVYVANADDACFFDDG